MSSPAKHARQVIAAVREDASPFGANVEVGYGNGGHPHLLITKGDETRRLAFANTPRDSNASLTHTRCVVRRLAFANTPRDSNASLTHTRCVVRRLLRAMEARQ